MNPLLLLTLLPPPVPAPAPPPGPVPAPAPRARARTYYTPASAVGPALADALSLGADAPQVRYVSAYNEADQDLPDVECLLTYVTNSLSFELPYPPVPVPGASGRLWRVDLDRLGISPKAWDDLVLKGSGRAPFPDPYFHLTDEVVEEVEETVYYGYYQDGYGRRVSREVGRANPGAYTWVRDGEGTEKVTRKRVKTALAPWLPEDDVVKLCALTDSQAPLVRADWLFYYALLEPRYHELLGLPDTEAQLKKLLGVDVKQADRFASVARGVVLESEVAPNNRALERVGTLARHGKSYYWESIDYDTSIGADDLLADVLGQGKAHEIIFTLPRNGLQGYMVTNGDGKRLDRAGAEFANDRRNPFRWVEVEIRNCFCCHATGLIDVRDAVREDANGPLALALRKSAGTSKRNRQVAERFFGVSLAGLINADRAEFAQAVKGVTTTAARPLGLAPAAASLLLQKHLIRYERSRTLADLAAETGYPAPLVLGVIERSGGTGLDHSVSRLGRPGAKSRYDHYEARGHGQLMRLLQKVPAEGPPPAARAWGNEP